VPELVGTVSDLWRYPVKSMGGERVERAQVTAAGIDSDRRLAVLDVETGRIASAKHPRRWGRLLELVATIDGERVRVTFPDGTVTSTGDDLDEQLSAMFDREVTVVDTAPEGAVFEEVWDDGKDDSPRYGTPTGKEEGRDVVSLPPSPIAPKGTFFDFSAIHLVTTSALAALAERRPASDLDVRRFRPNIVLEVADGITGFVENGWAPAELAIGDGDGGVALAGVIPTMRCVMTTLAQPGLDPDRDVLRTINAANRVAVASMGEYACLGLYCRVRGSGEVRVGDEVRLHDPS
jgi:uncharacterized protein